MHNPREVDDHATLINLDLFEVFDRFDHFLEAALSVTSFQHGFSFLDMPVYATLELLWKWSLSCCPDLFVKVVHFHTWCTYEPFQPERIGFLLSRKTLHHILVRRVVWDNLIEGLGQLNREYWLTWWTKVCSGSAKNLSEGLIDSPEYVYCSDVKHAFFHCMVIWLLVCWWLQTAVTVFVMKASSLCSNGILLIGRNTMFLSLLSLLKMVLCIIQKKCFISHYHLVTFF